MDEGIGALVGLFLLALYFAPSIVAALRSHRQTAAILVLNLLAGWTLVGWVIAMVWAFAAQDRPSPAGLQPSTSAAAPDSLAALERLAALRASGALTEDEFAAQKATVLAQGGGSAPRDPVSEPVVPEQAASAGPRKKSKGDLVILVAVVPIALLAIGSIVVSARDSFSANEEPKVPAYLDSQFELVNVCAVGTSQVPRLFKRGRNVSVVIGDDPHLVAGELEHIVTCQIKTPTANGWMHVKVTCEDVLSSSCVRATTVSVAGEFLQPM
jgi:hypothetical protein